MESKFNKWSIEQIQSAHTSQLLKELRQTYKLIDYDWTNEDYQELKIYRLTLKDELATREHIPNKKESKKLRKARIKKGK